LDTRWAHSTRIYPFLTELDTFGYQVGTGNKNLSVSYRVGHIWISGGHFQPEFYPFLTELDTFGYKVGTFNQNLSVPYRVGHIWISVGTKRTSIYPFFTGVNTVSGWAHGNSLSDYSSYPTSSISFNHPWKRNAKDGEK
jgi:hypothetical protein